MSAAADIFRTAAELNADSDRRGNVAHIGEGCDVIVAGDLHGNRQNLVKIINYAALGCHPNRRLVLQEIIHAPPDPVSGADRSMEVMLRALRLKVAHPHQVLFVMGNHDIAQVTGNEITKQGRGACRQFNDAVRAEFGDDADDILCAVNEFIMSMPMAARTLAGTFICHSLPSPGRMELAGVEIMSRPYEPKDLRRGGPVYEWTWGRDQTSEQVDRLAADLDADFFVLGHRHVAEGYQMITSRAMTLASDHPHGYVLHWQADQALTADNFSSALKPIATLGCG